LRDPASLVLVTLVTWLTAAVHELAHGVAARRHGVAVHEIGVHWLLPVFLLYCKVDDYLYVPRRRDQVVIAGSGVLVNFVLLLPVFALWSLLPAGPIVDALAALLLIDIGVALLNLLPVPPLDGYRMLSHALGMADYARQSVVFAVTALRRPAAVAAYPLGARIALAGYATGIFVVALGVAGGILVVGHSWTGSWLWPSVLLAALVLLNVLGAVYGARRLNRLGGTGATSAPGSGAVRPVPARSTARDAGPAIVLTDVRKRYGRRRAVDGVTFEVQRGEFLGLLGPNGAGKTTLVEIAVGLRPADSGSVAVLGRSPWPRDRDLLPRIGVQTQSAAFFVRHTAREHLRTVAALYGLGGAAAERALRLVGLTDLAEVRGERLSGGQRQRLAIAAALVHDPELIFLDEPTAALDPQARRALWEVLRQLHVAGRTIVYTTHHLDEAEALCDRVAIISNGRVLALDSPERLVKSAGRGTRLAVPRGRISPEQARALPGVTAAYAENGAVILETTDSTTVLAHLSTVAGLDGVQTRSTSLEDVYLHLVGKEHAA
jgi:ABC-type multidrug transport system ATPase subunit